MKICHLCCTFWKITLSKLLPGMILVLPFLFSCREPVSTFPLPEGEEVYDGYLLRVNGQPVDIYKCRVAAKYLLAGWPGSQRPLDHTEAAGFASWEMKNPVKVEVTSARPVERVTVRPLSLGIKPLVKGNRITFEADSIIPMEVEVNGYHEALHLFPNPLEKEVPLKGSSLLYYFGPGIHDVGFLHLNSNDSVYIAGGAVVYGAILASEADNIRIWGRGVLDGSRIPRSNLPYIGPGCITIFGSDHISIEGIVLRDPNRWCLNLFGCSDANISNVKLVGLWRINTDGISANNCRNVLVEKCFVRSFDAALEVKGVKGWETLSTQECRFARCGVWGELRRSLGITGETSAPYIENVTFENCDLIHNQTTAMAIKLIDRAFIRNITFNNINVESDEWIPRFVRQRSTLIENGWDTVKVCPNIVNIWITKNRTTQDPEPGIIDGVTFSNICVTGDEKLCNSVIRGFDKEHGVSNVTFRNLQINGKVAEDTVQAQLTAGPFATNIRFEK